MNKETLSSLKNVNTNKLINELNYALKVVGTDLSQSEVAQLLYLLYQASINQNIDIRKYDEIVETIDHASDIYFFFRGFSKIQTIWSKFIFAFSGKYSSEVYLACLMQNLSEFNTYRYSENSTSESIINLALKILDIKDNESVADICSGIGDFLINASIKADNLFLKGIELNTDSALISQLRLSLTESEFEIEAKDAFETLDSSERFDKVFINPPIAMNLKNIEKDMVLENLGISSNEYRSRTADWLFVLSALNKIKDNGKLVAFLPAGLLINSTETPIRKFLVDKNLVETVIALPSKMIEGTGVATCLLVLSKNNEKINFVNANDIYAVQRRTNTFTQENIDEIASLIGENTDISSVVDSSEVATDHYSLAPTKYLSVVEIENAVPFDTVIKRITRGAQLKADELDALNSENPTPYQYLMVSNINKGIIDLKTNPQYITEIAPNLDKYCLKNNSLILSKVAAPDVKVAVANFDEGQTILANGNLYIVELDETKVNPVYVQAFYSSKLGRKLISKSLNGTTFQIITLSSVKELPLVLPPLEEQNKIAEKYIAVQNKIQRLREELVEAEKELTTVINA